MDKATVYVFNVTLNDSDCFGMSRKPFQPKIWRRIHLPSHANFANLHDMIQDSMGWVETHLHNFQMKHPVSGKDIELVPQYETKGENDSVNENNALISEYFTPQNRTAVYTYDFGDNWDHTVKLEEIIECRGKDIEILACVAGEGLGPPEDCGGAHGYRELMKTLRSPGHPEHDDSKNWVTNACSNRKEFFDKIVNGYEFDPADVKMRLVLGKYPKIQIIILAIII